MFPESLKYFLLSSLNLKTLLSYASLELPIIDPISLMEICEEVWFLQDKEEALFILNTYSNLITDYQYKLLCGVLFGEELIEAFEEEEFSILKIIQNYLDRLLTILIF